MMLIFIFFSCQKDHLDNNKKKSSTPYICESEEKSISLYSDLEPQISDWNGHWSHFFLPQNTENIYTYPHAKGIFLSVHTAYDFLERDKNHSYLYWWGQDCFGAFTAFDIPDCSSKSFEQICIIQEQDRFFGHVIFLTHTSDSIESVSFTDTLYQLSESSVPVSRILDKNQNIYYQNRQNVYDENFLPILSQDANRYILDFLPTDDGILVSQLQPQLEIQRIQKNNDTFELAHRLSAIKPLQNQQWAIWSDSLLSLQRMNSLHVSSLPSLQTFAEIPLSSNFLQICANQKIWALSDDKKLISFTIDLLSNTITEGEVYPLQLDAEYYQLYCSSHTLYLYDKINQIFHRRDSE